MGSDASKSDPVPSPITVPADEVPADATASPETTGGARQKEAGGGEDDAAADDEAPGGGARDCADRGLAATPHREEAGRVPAAEDPAGASPADGGAAGAPTEEGESPEPAARPRVAGGTEGHQGEGVFDFDYSECAAAELLRKEPGGGEEGEEEEEEEDAVDFDYSKSMARPLWKEASGARISEGAADGSPAADDGATADDDQSGRGTTDGQLASAPEEAQKDAEEETTRTVDLGGRRHPTEDEEEEGALTRRLATMAVETSEKEEEEEAGDATCEPPTKPHSKDPRRATRARPKEPRGARVLEGHDRSGAPTESVGEPPAEEPARENATFILSDGEGGDTAVSGTPAGQSPRDPSGSHISESEGSDKKDDNAAMEGGDSSQGGNDLIYLPPSLLPIDRERAGDRDPSGSHISESDGPNEKDDNDTMEGGDSSQSGNDQTDTLPSSLPLHANDRDPSGSHISESERPDDNNDDDAIEGVDFSQGDSVLVDTLPSSLPLDGEHEEDVHDRRTSSDPTLHLPLHQEQIGDLSLDKEIRPSPFDLNAMHIPEATREGRSPAPPTGAGPSVGIAAPSPSRITYGATTPPPLQRHRIPGRRSVTLRLLEEVPPPPRPPSTPRKPLLSSVGTPFRSLARFGRTSRGHAGRTRAGSLDGGLSALDERAAGAIDGGVGSGSTVDRGIVAVSWYEGTTSTEMQEHVFNCVLRKLNGDKRGRKAVGLEDVRLLDENVTPHGEVVLCPFLPDGARFLLKFKVSVERPPTPEAKRPEHRPPYASRAPDSPSAEPSPYPSHANLPSLDPMNGASGTQQRWQQQNEQQMQLLNTVAALLQQQQQQQQQQQTSHHDNHTHYLGLNANPNAFIEPLEAAAREPHATLKPDDTENTAVTNAAGRGLAPEMESITEHLTTDQLIEDQLRQLNYLFAQRRSGVVTPANGGPSMGTGLMNGTTNNDHQSPNEQMMIRAYHRAEKKQVIFVISNYLVFFLGLIALSAEIQSRLPSWMEWVQDNYDSVQNCATNRDALVECLANGDFSGLVASFLLWATQSAAAKRIFLFGFDTPKKLWTVVYEALVTAVCWGTSYLFIRRGLNPNTRENFLHKYWKDAVYGSLAGFNAAFMKAVLKNLVPQDVALEALEGGRQLRIFRWLGAASAHQATHPALE